ncbi:MAG: peptide-methionine (S)-S-oxide reductase [Fluviicola sp.]|nr:MAG: peptide-methionine (S)-S-oxide reductase [Fluviicola sp.]
MQKNIIHFLIISILAFGCSANEQSTTENTKLKEGKSSSEKVEEIETNAVAYFASGCFWCVEAVFESVTGVGDVISGYSGGKKSNANYRAVSAGITDHAEAVAVHYDSTKIDYPTLLKVFFGSHDPTTLNQQGPDRGTQYRSAIFYRNQKEKKLAKEYIEQLLTDKVFPKITTEVVGFDAFYPAEDYHQNYEKKNPNNSYVRNVSIPRLKKFQKQYPELLK